jgi:PilZ domain
MCDDFSMSTKRSLERVKKRLKVEMKAGGLSVIGYTTNVSAGGFAIAARKALNPGTQLIGSVELPDQTRLDFNAQVRWAVRPPGALAQHVLSAMGLQFTSPPGEGFFKLLPGA